jgi:hypothetical protein
MDDSYFEEKYEEYLAKLDEDDLPVSFEDFIEAEIEDMKEYLAECAADDYDQEQYA